MRTHALVSLAFALTVLGLTVASGADLYVDGSGGGCGGSAPCYTTIQAAVSAAFPGDVIHVAAWTYQLPNDSPIRVNKGVTLVGDVVNPSNVVIKAPASGAFQGRASVFVLSHTSGTVTIRGFTIRDAPMLGGSNQNAGIWIGHTGDTQVYPVDNVVIEHNVIDNCANGIVMDANQNVTIRDNMIRNSPRPAGTWTGTGIVAFNRGQWRTCLNLEIDGNEIKDNARAGISIENTDPPPPPWGPGGTLDDTQWYDIQTTISGNTIANNGGDMSDVGAGFRMRGVLLSTNFTGVTIRENRVSGHVSSPAGPASSAGLTIYGCKAFQIEDNDIIDNHYGIRIEGVVPAPGSTTEHILEGNLLQDNIQNLRVLGNAGHATNNRFIVSTWTFPGVPTLNIANTGAAVFDASGNDFGSADPAAFTPSLTPSLVDYTPWLTGGSLLDPGFAGDFSLLWVDDGGPQWGSSGRISEAVGLVTGSTVHVLDGTYTEHVIANKPLMLLGPNAGVNPNTETRGLEAEIQTDDLTNHPAILIASSDVTIDGITLYGPNGAIKDIGAVGLSGSGPRTNVHVQYNRIFRTAGGTDWNGDGIRLDPSSGDAASIFIEHNRIEVGPEQEKGNNDISIADHGYRMAHGTGWTVGDPDRVTIRDNWLYGHSKMYMEGIGILIDGNRFLGTWGPIEIRGAKDVVVRSNTIVDQYDVGIFAWSPQSASGAGLCTDLEITQNTITGMQLDPQNFTDEGTAIVLAGVTNALVTGNTIGGGGGGGIVIGGVGYDHFYPEDIGWGGGLECGYDPLNNVVNENAISGNAAAGLDNRTALLADAACNWWGDGLGPNVPPTNPSPGDDLVGAATYAPWWSTSTGPCDGYGPNNVAASTTGLCLGNAHTCVTVPVLFTRADTTPARAASVTFELSSNLELCGSMTASIHPGTWLAGYTNTVFEVYDNGGGSYTADQAILGLPCGKATGGQLFTVDVKRKAGEPDGAGTITVTEVLIRDCDNAPLPGIPGAPGELGIDFTAPVAVSNMSAAQVKASNDTDGTTKIQVSFTAPGDAAVVEVYRAGYGQYPEYDDGGGAVPATPAVYPPAAPWALTSVTASGQTDEVATRDFYYYVVYTKDACGNISLVSNKTTGTLNYHLGDVAPLSPGHPENLVDGLDISALGAYYGKTLVLNDPYNYLDVGPTTNYSVNGRPLTDNRVNFEDLLMFAMNFGLVSKADLALADLGAVGSGPVRLEAVPQATSVRAGQVVEVPVALMGEVSGVQGVHTVLTYDARRFSYVSSEVTPAIEPTEHFFMDLPSSGQVDLSLALLGTGASMSGEGTVMTVRLRALRDGALSVSLKESNVRDTENHELLYRAAEQDRGAASGTTASASLGYRLGEARPNPFDGRTAIAFSVPEAAAVRVVVYDVAGRVVRALAEGVWPAGEHVVEWDGRDDLGRSAGSGVYFYALQAGAYHSQKRMTVLR